MQLFGRAGAASTPVYAWNVCDRPRQITPTRAFGRTERQLRGSSGRERPDAVSPPSTGSRRTAGEARGLHASRRLQRRVLPYFSLLAAWSACALPVRAQSDSTSVDTARGALTGSTRRIGLGGAFVALADDSEGVAINPASVALRLPHSWDVWDYGLGIDFSIGAWLPKNDLYNRGDAEGQSKSTALFGSIAAVLYAGHFGAGFAAEAQRNAASRPDQEQGISRSLAANFGLVHTNFGYGFLDGQLLFGAGFRFVGMSFDRSSDSGGLSTAGVGYETGFIIKPQTAQYRVAASYKSPIDASLSGDDTVHVPWELALGFAYQFGPRVFNPRFVSADEVARRRKPEVEKHSKADLAAAKQELFETYQRQQRWYLLVSTELALAEGDGERRGLERIWTSADSVSNSRPVIVPRVGVESEVVPHILRLRAGSYYEPERVDMSPARVHGTGGFDVRLFEWDVFGLVKPFDWWQLSVAADAARSYLNTSFSIGFWH